MQYQRFPRHGKGFVIVAAETNAATEIQYTIQTLNETELLAVHYRVRRLFLWEKWIPMREPSFYTYEAACRYLGTILRQKNARPYDPIVAESMASEG